MKFYSLLIGSLMLVSLQSCKKVEGEGGDASVRGKVYYKHYNSTFTNLLNEGFYPDTYVYIIYGDDVNYGQRIKTNYNGEFEFNFLYRGDYRIYTYSVDSAATVDGVISPQPIPVIAEFTLSKRKEKVDVGTLSVYN